MLPNDDDNYEGDYTSIIPRQVSGRVPGPVVAYARSRLSSMILAGDGEDELHQGFSCSFEGSKWDILVRQVATGYKLIFQGGVCRDRDPFLLVQRIGFDPVDSFEPPYPIRPTSPPDQWFAYYTDGTTEEIDPADGTRIEIGPKTKGWKLPTALTTAYPTYKYPDPIFGPFGANGYLASSGLNSASMFTGQMRTAVQDCYARGSRCPFTHVFVRTHGIVEYPHPRVIGVDEADERTKNGARKWWVVEIGADGVYAAKTRDTKRSCDSFKCAGMEPNSDLSLKTYKDDHPESTVVKLLDGTDLGGFYTDGYAHPMSWGWHFSYSGHEAQAVVFRTAAGPYGGTSIYASRAKLSFSASIVDDVLVLAAAFSWEEQDILMQKNNLIPFGWTLRLNEQDGFFDTRSLADLYPSANAATYNDGDTRLDYPVYVFYDGDDERIVRCKHDYDTAVSGGVSTITSHSSIEVTGAVTRGGDYVDVQTPGASGSDFVHTHNGYLGAAGKVLGHDKECVFLEDAFHDWSDDNVGTEIPNEPPIGAVTTCYTQTATGTVTREVTLVARSEIINYTATHGFINGVDSPFFSTFCRDHGSTTWTEGEYDNHIEPVFFMGGGLYYEDQTLDTPNQRTNKVLLAYDNTYGNTHDMTFYVRMPADSTTTGGMAQPDNHPASFVGRI